MAAQNRGAVTLGDVILPTAAPVEPDDASEDGIEDILTGEVELGPGSGVGAISFRDQEERIAGALEGTDAEAVAGADDIIAFGLNGFAGDFGLVEEDEVTV